MAAFTMFIFVLVHGATYRPLRPLFPTKVFEYIHMRAADWQIVSFLNQTKAQQLSSSNHQNQFLMNKQCPFHYDDFSLETENTLWRDYDIADNALAQDVE